MKEQKNPSAVQPRNNQINKRPGRCVCVCTAKGKILYMEDIFTYNKNKGR